MSVPTRHLMSRSNQNTGSDNSRNASAVLHKKPALPPVGSELQYTNDENIGQQLSDIETAIKAGDMTGLGIMVRALPSPNIFFVGDLKKNSMFGLRREKKTATLYSPLLLAVQNASPDAVNVVLDNLLTNPHAYLRHNRRLVSAFTLALSNVVNTDEKDKDAFTARMTTLDTLLSRDIANEGSVTSFANMMFQRTDMHNANNMRLLETLFSAPCIDKIGLVRHLNFPYYPPHGTTMTVIKSVIDACMRDARDALQEAVKHEKPWVRRLCGITVPENRDDNYNSQMYNITRSISSLKRSFNTMSNDVEIYKPYSKYMEIYDHHAWAQKKASKYRRTK